MKTGPWQWLKRVSALLAAPRPEPAEHAQRLVALQRNIIMPARLLVIGGVFYHLYSSPWLGVAVDTYGVLFETIQSVFATYAFLSVAAAVVFYVVRRFPPGIVQWFVFIIGLGDGVFLGGLTVLTGGFESVLYWVYPGVILLNAISIPLATPQIVLNLVLSIFYLEAGLLEISAHESEMSGPIMQNGSRIRTAEIKDLPALVTWLKQAPDPIPKYLWERVSGPTHAKLSTYLETGAQLDETKAALVEDLNHILFGVRSGSRIDRAEIKDLPALVIWMKQAPDPMPKHLWEQMSESTRTKLSTYLETSAQPEETKTALVEELNRIFFPTPRYVLEQPPVEPVETAADPYVLRVVVLVLLSFCCYGVQVLAAGQRRALEEQEEFIARTSQLRAAGRLAAEFAHQIKNPLAIVNNVTFSLQKALKDSKPEITQQVGIIREEVARADQIITQIMGYAQLSEGRVEKLDVPQEIERIIQEIFPPGIETGVTLHQEIGDDFPPLLMQRRHFSEAIGNLLQNAREALAGPGNVFVAARCLGDAAVEVTVRDDGPGIPPDKMERIFEAYYTTKERGTGLGLAIVKHDVELYGGSVRVESGLGKGAKFTLTFPARTWVRPDR